MPEDDHPAARPQVAAAALTGLVVAALTLLAPAAASAVVRTYSSSPAAVIPDALPPGPGTPQSISDSLAVPDSGSLLDVDVTVSLSHPEHGDLALELTDPSGTVTVRLINTEGGPGDGFANVTFDDEAAGLPPDFVVNGTCLVDTSYRPAPGSLADFDGLEAQGVWTLTVIDVFTGDASDCDCDGFVVGPVCPRTLDSWSLSLELEGDTGDGDSGLPELTCVELLLVLLLILVLIAILWFLMSKARP